jgi:hypothetical protein
MNPARYLHLDPPCRCPYVRNEPSRSIIPELTSFLRGAVIHGFPRQILLLGIRSQVSGVILGNPLFKKVDYIPILSNAQSSGV